MITIIVIIVLALALLVMYMHYNNREVALRKEATAQESKITTVHDTMWKILKDKLGVTDAYRETFERVYPEIIAGRYSDGGSAMKWIQEANPNFDTSLYHDLMQSIEVQRTLFATSQQRMLDIIRERATLLESMPACWFIKNKSEIKYEVISSDRTEQVIATRRDNETLF